MIGLSIDTTKFTGMFCVTEPEARVANRETGQLKKDRESGQTLYQVGVCVMAGTQAEVITVSVPGEPKGLTRGTPVQVRDLVATPWAMGDRNGIAFRASAITALTATSAKAAS